MAIVVGGVVEQDGKYLLVQEAKQKCYGKWNLPAGHLDPNELVFEGAVREIKEETNCDVELTGICSITSQRREEPSVYFVFATKILTSDVKPQEGEILEAKWFTYDEAVALGEQLRVPAWIIHALTIHRNGQIMPLDTISILNQKGIA